MIHSQGDAAFGSTRADHRRTQLGLKDRFLLDDFFGADATALEQAQDSTGGLGPDALADAKLPAPIRPA